MKLQLLIAIGHQDYMEHLSDVLTQRYGETFEVSVCSTGERLRELLSRRRFDAALLDETLAEEADLSAVRLPLLLWDGAAALGPHGAEMEKLRKYQRISTMTGQVLERYAAVCDSPAGFETGRGRITAVWSPAGGCIIMRDFAGTARFSFAVTDCTNGWMGTSCRRSFPA